MKTKTIILSIIFITVFTISWFVGPENNYHPQFSEFKTNNGGAYAYPPAVGILSKSRDCLECHIDNGPWTDDSKTIIDVLDAGTNKSLKQADGSFLIEVKRNQTKTIQTVIGRVKGDLTEEPYRNAWIYIDPQTIGTSSLNKFANGWECNLPISCRLIGDKHEKFEGAKITSLPMTVRPTSSAKNTELELQAMLTKGEAVKEDPYQGMLGNYFLRKVKLRVIE